MNSSNLLSVVTFGYGLAATLYLASWVFHKEAPARWGRWLVWTSVLGNLTGMLWRWIESYQMGFGHAPLSNLYESLVFFAFVIAVVYLVVEIKYKSQVLGAFAMPLAFLAMAYASLSPNISGAIQPLLPALKSNWLIAHVMTCFVGYSAFAIGFGVSFMYLFRASETVEAGGGLLARLPKPRMLDELNHQLTMFGFLFLTAGIITGAVWANSAWGRYWGWDPKETWSLITWFIYATVIHARLMRGWQGKRIAYLSILGFAAVMFTYFGVNYLPGLHSYGAN